VVLMSAAPTAQDINAFEVDRHAMISLLSLIFRSAYAPRSNFG
jgi:hypothetical protein